MDNLLLYYDGPDSRESTYDPTKEKFSLDKLLNMSNTVADEWFRFTAAQILLIATLLGLLHGNCCCFC